MTLSEKKPVALVSPVIGEFGFTVFDIQQRVRSFFRKHPDHHKVVIGHPSLHGIFELADEMVSIDLPPDYCPCGRGADFEYHSSNFYEDLHKKALSLYDVDSYFKINYENRFDQWDTDREERKFQETSIVPDEKYMAISCRSIERGSIKNWSPAKYDALLDKINQKYNIPIYLVGLPKDNYCPESIIVPEAKNVRDHISLLSNSMIFFGSNTGTTHLALLCGCPVFSWGKGAHDRMVRETNPFGTSIMHIDKTWDPDVDEMYNKFVEFMESEIL
jgi:hypothetical protein